MCNVGDNNGNTCLASKYIQLLGLSSTLILHHENRLWALQGDWSPDLPISTLVKTLDPPVYRFEVHVCMRGVTVNSVVGHSCYNAPPTTPTFSLLS